MDTKNRPELDTIWDEARTHIEAGRLSKAVEIYNYILIRYSDDAIAVEFAHAYLGEVYLTLKQTGPAEEHINKAIKSRPENPDYHYILGFIYSYKQLWNKAIAEFEQAITKKPGDAEFLRGLGWAMYQQGDTKKGLELLHRAHSLDPNNINILTDLASAYLANDINKAKVYAEMAAALEPGDVFVKKVRDTVLDFDEKFKQFEGGQTDSRDEESDEGFYFPEIFRFKVALKENPEIWRIIEIKYDQRLSTLHKAICTAFNRVNDTYSFFFKDRHDKDTEFAASLPGTTGAASLASRLQVNSIFLYMHDDKQKFLCLSDYAEKVWYEVEYLGMTDKPPRGTYPRVVKKQGRAPVQ